MDSSNWMAMRSSNWFWAGWAAGGVAGGCSAAGGVAGKALRRILSAALCERGVQGGVHMGGGGGVAAAGGRT
eukprot:995204-Amphidinium_carterae.1